MAAFLPALPGLAVVLAVVPVLADQPMHTLPWYFGGAVFAFWVAAAAGFALLFRRLMRARAERRRDGRRGQAGRDRPPIRDDRSLESGKDLELW